MQMKAEALLRTAVNQCRHGKHAAMETVAKLKARQVRNKEPVIKRSGSTYLGHIFFSDLPTKSTKDSWMETQYVWMFEISPSKSQQ
jgi:hypothetical protein